MTIAATHPGKHGDALYALPTIRALCDKHGTKADFYTSAYCEPLRSLFEAQDCINRFIVAPTYVIERMDMGVQPWYVPVDASQYQAVYQLGFRQVPNCSIPEAIAREAGVQVYPIHYDLPDGLPRYSSLKDYIVIAPRASEDYAPLFDEIIRQSPYPCVVVGGAGDDDVLDDNLSFWSATATSYLYTASIIAQSRAFVGLMSSQLCLANGFPISRISPHDGKSWDLRHVVRSEYNYYPVKPSAEMVLRLIKRETELPTYSKTIEQADYQTSDLFQHVQNMEGVLSGTYTAWGTEHRRWEYGTVLTALRENGARTVLEVGGGSSMFAAAAMWAGFDVTVVDPENYLSMFQQQGERIGKVIPFVHADFFDYPVEQFDAVTCVSVIEHVHEDVPFFMKLLRHVKVGGLLCLTTDFHPSGVAIFGGHIRCYSADMLMNFVALAKEQGFEVYGGAPDYSHFEQNVHGIYTFASLVLKRVK